MVKMEIQRMKRDMLLQTYQSDVQLALNADPKPILLAVLNVRSLSAHHKDLLLQLLINDCTLVCLTKTWLTQKDSDAQFALPHCRLLRKDRCASEGSSASGHRNAHGGVCTDVSCSVQGHEHKLPIDDSTFDLQCLDIKLPEHQHFCVVTIYRPLVTCA